MVFSLLVLLTLGLSVAAEQVDTWALDEFSLHCNDSCTYKFDIFEGLYNIDKTRQTVCTFSIAATGTQPASNTSFQSVVCENKTDYRINGGWDPLGFIVLCISNIQDDTWSYFGYARDELSSGRPAAMKESPAYNIGTFTKWTPARSEPPRKRTRREADLSTEWWRVYNVNRFVDVGFDGNDDLRYSFTIIDNHGLVDECEINLSPPKWTADPLAYSWYNQLCGNRGWHVSWGYNSITDSAVMTIVNPPRNKVAYFGWDNVHGPSLPDVGPNDVLPCNCG